MKPIMRPIPEISAHDQAGHPVSCRSAKASLRLKVSVEKIREKISQASFILGSCLFFLAFYLYVWLLINPCLIHHGIGVQAFYHPFSFHTGWSFLEENLARPGGVVEYAGRFLAELFRFDWLGALILTVLAWFSALATDILCYRAGWTQKTVLRFVPALLLLMLYGGYSQPLMAVLSLLSALFGFKIYVYFAPANRNKRLIYLFLFASLCYWIAGSGSILFLILVMIDEGMIGRSLFGAAVAFGILLVIPAMATFRGLAWTEAYWAFLISDPGTFSRPKRFILFLFLFFIVVFLGTALWQLRKNSHSSAIAFTKIRKARPDTFLLSPTLKHLIPGTLVLLGMLATVVFWLDPFTRTVLEMDYFTQQELWTEALSVAAKIPPGTFIWRCQRNVTLALCQTGRLGEEMFRYPQRPHIDLRNTPRILEDPGDYFQLSRFYLALGDVNLAEKYACEALENCGDLPDLLEELALIYIVKDRPQMAQIVLNVLSRHPFHHQAGLNLKQQLKITPDLATDPRVVTIRQNLRCRDNVVMEADPCDYYQGLLETNPRNRMALELLLAQYLCDGQPGKVVAYLPRLQEFGYPKLPRHYQEAVLVQAKDAASVPTIPGYELDPDIVARWHEFRHLMEKVNPNLETRARAALEAGFGDSYFFYFSFLCLRMAAE